MGGRGNFVDVHSRNFAFIDGGQTYFTIGSIDDVIKVIERPCGSVKSPEISHTEDRIYAIVQKQALKHLAFYNNEHHLIKSIDFKHFHDGKKPHVHYDVNHKGLVTYPSINDYIVIEKVEKWINNYYKRR